MRLYPFWKREQMGQRPASAAEALAILQMIAVSKLC
jgi:hypothetical protein